MPEDYVGFTWHLHHDVLVEWCYSYEDRVRDIQKNKPENEQEARLRLFKPVKGKLPAVVTKAWDAFDKAGDAFDKAWDAYSKARDAFDKARDAYAKASDAFDNAWNAYGKAINGAMPDILKLHAKECPNCPWDGHTIFPARPPDGG